MEMGKVIQKNGLLLPGIVYDIVPSTISYPILLSGGRIAAIVGFFFLLLSWRHVTAWEVDHGAWRLYLSLSAMTQLGLSHGLKFLCASGPHLYIKMMVPDL